MTRPWRNEAGGWVGMTVTMPTSPCFVDESIPVFVVVGVPSLLLPVALRGTTDLTNYQLTSMEPPPTATDHISVSKCIRRHRALSASSTVVGFSS